ncbi:hypothetical protein BC937DRAFT_86409 [Endogone sp. FLAS-F59071]|nr:hypothetical protein BC937DRAFT_86409 [Endogone sp. FLAS-F59071]|eukprot:RUS13064.1 hypothetical protein BC937DRAFT_86409 [Endogone sp. FLAS-F59071]
MFPTALFTMFLTIRLAAQAVYQAALYQLESLFVRGTIGGPIPSLRQWKNFNGQVKFGLKSSDYLTPSTFEELKQMVIDARDNGYTIKPVGSGHSFNDITLKAARGKVVSLREKYNRLISVDKENKTVTLQGGMVIRTLCRELEKHGLGLHNIGNYYEQTVGGALATGTHGTTGKNHLDTFTSIIKRLELITSNGDVVVIDGKDSVTIGTLGIIHQITLSCVDMFWIEHRIIPIHNINDFTNEEDVNDLLAKNDFMFFRWITMAGSTERATLETFNIVHDKNRVTPLNNILIQLSILIKYWFLLPVGNYIPVWLSKFITNHIVPLFPERRIDAYYLALAVPGLIAAHFESEWALPHSKLHSVMQHLTKDREEFFGRSVVEIHIRFSPADSARLSPANGKDTVWVDVNVPDLNLNVDELCRNMIKAGGRPHWSKVHHMLAPQIALLGYDFSHLKRMRNDLDPNGVFSTSPYIERVLGHLI